MDMSSAQMQSLQEAEQEAAQAADAPAANPMIALLARARDAATGVGEVMGLAGQLQAHRLNEAAVLLYGEWLAHHRTEPLQTVVLYNLGTILGTLSRHGEAEQVYRRALALKPDFTQARLNLGHQLEHLGRHEEALAQWREVGDAREGLDSVGADALELRLHALNNAARLLETLRRYDESEACMRQSLTLKADQGDVLQHYVHIRQKQCAWPIYQPVGEVTHNQLLVYTSLLATLSATDDPAVQLMSASRYVAEKVVKYKDRPFHKRFGPAARDGRLRIGYLSGDLCMHAVGLLTAELYELHDRSRFETFAFCWSREDGTPLRARILRAFEHHVPIAALDDETAARRIAEVGIDVLIDLQGLTSGARANILAYRPAPVQVAYLGLPATSAIPGVDWIIADRFVMPPEYLPYCSERPIYLDHCYQVSDRQREIAPTPQRATYQLPEDAFVFCSFNNNHKYTEAMFDCWMRILQQVERSVLWLLGDNEWAKASMRARAAAHGIAAERLLFAPRVSPAEYLARFRLADLVLDTFPYNAGTTASDCLWAGAPMLTLSGRSYISRMAGSLLTHVGLPDLVTHSLAEYEQRAVQIGCNPARAESYKRFLSEHGHGSVLFDMPGMVRELEDKLEALVLERRAPRAA